MSVAVESGPHPPLGPVGRGANDTPSGSRGCAESLAAALIGTSPQTVELRRELAAWSGLLTPLVLQGEAGVGKTLIARTLHQARYGEERPYIEISCSEIEGTRGELARLVSAAWGGSLVLDNVDELCPVAQQRLSEILSCQPTPPRLIATLGERASDDKSSLLVSNLRIHLAGVHLRVAPLRERAEDVRVIAQHELRRLRAEVDAAPPAVSADALARLESCRWAGNVGELLFVVRQLANDLPVGEVVDDSDVREALRQARLRFGARACFDGAMRRKLIGALDANGWNVSAAARSLGVSRGWLRRRIDALEIR